MLVEIGPAPSERPRVFVCGPTGFVEVAADLLVALGHDPASIRTSGSAPPGVEMEEQALWLDGNAIAGLLWELLGAELTAAPRRCQSCGQVRKIGEHRLYHGAGLVLRCPVCSDIAARIASLPTRHVVELRGSWQLQLPAR